MNSTLHSTATQRQRELLSPDLPVIRLAGRPEAAGLREAVRVLLQYCRMNGWSGYDPYDALNSRLFAATPFSRSRLCRLAFTQVLKRLPFNARPLLQIPRAQNPKAMGLFLAALLKLERLGLAAEQSDADTIIDRLEQMRSPRSKHWCWGYSFPWQTRTDLVPVHAPNLVCTTFVANALLDAAEQRNDARCRDMAESAAAYLARELYWTAEDGAAGFSYPHPGTRSQIHNANLLGAALLCRVASLSGDRTLRDAAMKVARHAVSRQQSDGSWYYGEEANQRWVDNFHTGYNLCALRAIGRHAETAEFEPSLRRGYAFYQDRFFRADGAPTYFHDRGYPVDAHAVAQTILTLAALADLDGRSDARARSVLAWALEHLRDETGFFYYQVWPRYRNRISYMRWTQAWMLLALAALLERHDHAADGGMQ